MLVFHRGVVHRLSLQMVMFSEYVSGKIPGAIRENGYQQEEVVKNNNKSHCQWQGHEP